MADKRTHRELLDESWAAALVGSDIWERFLDARSELRDCVDRIEDRIRTNPLSEVVAREAARQSKRRGEPSLVVDGEGRVYLEVVYAGPSKTLPARSVGETPPKRDWKSDLPSLSFLRSQAEAMGIDPEPFGRRKRALQEAIQAKRNGAAPGRPKMRKTAPAVGPVTVIDPTSDDLPS